MRVSAKADYALRAVIELAATGDGPVKGERIARAQEIPLKFLENILGDLRQAGIVRSQRGVGPDRVEYAGSAARLQDVWIAVRANLRGVLEHVTVADLARGELPESIAELAADPEAWLPH